MPCPFLDRAGMPSRPTAREALTRIASPGWRSCARRARAASAARRELTVRPVGARDLADGDDEVDPELVEPTSS